MKILTGTVTECDAYGSGHTKRHMVEAETSLSMNVHIEEKPGIIRGVNVTMDKHGKVSVQVYREIPENDTSYCIAKLEV